MDSTDRIALVDDVMPGKVLGRKRIELDRRLVDLYESSLGIRRASYRRIAPPLLLSTEPWGWPGAYLAYWTAGVASKMTWRSFEETDLGTAVEVVATVADRFVRRNRETSVVEATAFADDGRKLVSGTGSYAAKVDPDAVRPDVRREPESEKPASSQPVSGWVAREVTITREMSQAFWAHRDDLGDGNFHVNPEAAKAFGLPDVMIGSSQLVALSVEHILDIAGQAWIEGGSIEVTFTAAVTAGDALRIRTARAPSDGGTTRHQLEILNHQDRTVLTGLITYPNSIPEEALP
jgi:acyl dehydratase